MHPKTLVVPFTDLSLLSLFAKRFFFLFFFFYYLPSLHTNFSSLPCRTVLISLTSVVVLVISTDWISWDNLNRGFLPSDEISRAFLASFILVFDLLIVMQVECSLVAN